MPNPAIEKKFLKIGGYSPCATAFFLEELAKGLGKRICLVCESTEQAESLARDLQFFMQFRARQWQNIPLLVLPGWDQNPYSNIQSNASIKQERMETLSKIVQPNSEWVLVSSFDGILQCVPEHAVLNSKIDLKQGTKLDPEELCLKLEILGYRRSETVEDPGSFCTRGGIVDIFGIGCDMPTRLEFLDTEIEAIRFFNVESQRSIRVLTKEETFAVQPCQEFFHSTEFYQLARENIRNWCDAHDLPRSSRDRVLSLLGQNIFTPEMDRLLPFFQNNPGFLTELIPAGTVLVLSNADGIRFKMEEWQEKLKQSFTHSLEKQQIFPEPERLYQDWKVFWNAACWKQTLEISSLAGPKEEPQFRPIKIRGQDKHSEVKNLVDHLQTFRERKCHTIILSSSIAQTDRIRFLLKEHKLSLVEIHYEEELKSPTAGNAVYLANGTISESLEILGRNFAFITEDEIFGQKSHLRKQRRAKQGPAIFVDELQPGDLVVHYLHGIGKFLGLIKITGNSGDNDFVQLEYADGDRLYVPIYRLDLLTKYISAPNAVGVLNKLGTNNFQKAKDKVRIATKDIAIDLLRVQAARETRKGNRFSTPDEEFRTFEAEFPYEETPDQGTAIEDTILDMCRDKSMDRLVCGDVGFGKTEVAIRAAFKAVQDGKQVAVLVPTTILAEQHFATFSNRFSAHPFHLACLSRFRSKKEQAAILSDLKTNKLDLVIGTHRLLSRDVQFRDLGLIVVDEEQRFGVEHKEKLKQLKATCDVLTLTATPIPRTLQMSLMGLKDVSVIRTPPGERLSIRTYMSVFDEEVIQSAIRQEIQRGGQVFFIHNRVQTIHQVQKLLLKLVPEAKTVVAHGQMGESQLEHAMLGFYKKEFDVLIATTIIENGLDVPNANTLIVDRADTFGLSQLYQIRGRVGRSQTRAFAYFLIPEHGGITDEARERLTVLQRFVELGSGYSIAMHDLELRGGGDILGQAQSGQIALVGYDLYLELLQEQIMALRGEKIEYSHGDIEINLSMPALLPETYVPDMKSRLQLYRKLSIVNTEDQVLELEKELRDRYGSLPQEALDLLWVLRLKILLRKLHLQGLNLGPKGVSLVPGKDPLLEPATILHLVNSYPDRYQILPEGKFVIKGAFSSVSEVYDGVRHLWNSTTQ